MCYYVSYIKTEYKCAINSIQICHYVSYIKTRYKCAITFHILKLNENVLIRLNILKLNTNVPLCFIY